MCQFCDDNQQKPVECTDCSRPICLNVNVGDSMIQPAYITRSGELLCEVCGQGRDAAASIQLPVASDEFQLSSAMTEEERAFVRSISCPLCRVAPGEFCRQTTDGREMPVYLHMDRRSTVLRQRAAA